MFTVRLFMIASNVNGLNTGQFHQYEQCSSWHRLDECNIQFTDKEGKTHFSNLPYEVIEEK